MKWITQNISNILLLGQCAHIPSNYRPLKRQHTGVDTCLIILKFIYSQHPLPSVNISVPRYCLRTLYILLEHLGDTHAYTHLKGPSTHTYTHTYRTWKGDHWKIKSSCFFWFVSISTYLLFKHKLIQIYDFFVFCPTQMLTYYTNFFLYLVFQSSYFYVMRFWVIFIFFCLSIFSGFLPHNKHLMYMTKQ